MTIDHWIPMAATRTGPPAWFKGSTGREEISRAASWSENSWEYLWLFPANIGGFCSGKCYLQLIPGSVELFDFFLFPVERMKIWGKFYNSIQFHTIPVLEIRWNLPFLICVWGCLRDDFPHMFGYCSDGSPANYHLQNSLPGFVWKYATPKSARLE